MVGAAPASRLNLLMHNKPSAQLLPLLRMVGLPAGKVNLASSYDTSRQQKRPQKYNPAPPQSSLPAGEIHPVPAEELHSSIRGPTR